MTTVRLSSIVKELQRIPPARVSEATGIVMHPETWRTLMLSAESLVIFGVELNCGIITFCGKTVQQDTDIAPGRIEVR